VVLFLLYYCYHLTIWRKLSWFLSTTSSHSNLVDKHTLNTASSPRVPMSFIYLMMLIKMILHNAVFTSSFFAVLYSSLRLVRMSCIAYAFNRLATLTDHESVKDFKTPCIYYLHSFLYICHSYI
jgi:hypothetical protein